MKESGQGHDQILSAESVLYGEQTKLTLENMSFTNVHLAQFPFYIAALAQVKKACANANAKAGALDEKKARLIAAACDRLAQGEYLDQFPVDVFHGGGGIGINMNINEVLHSLTNGGAHAIDDINACQSTSDVCHTALRISLIRLLGGLDEALEALLSSVERKADEFHAIITIARTCWQDGMKIPLAAMFEGLAAALTRQRAQIGELRAGLHRINLGWTVVGSGTGATDAYRAHILAELGEATGLPMRWRENLYDAAQYPDDLARASAEVKIIAGILSKFARDLRLLSSGPETGLGELKVPAVQAGSSFFPGKVNPVIPEMMIQCAMLVSGNNGIIQDALDLGEVHLNLWEEMMGFLLMENITMLTKATHLFNVRCVKGIEANEAVCAAYANSSIPLIVEYKEKYGYQKLCQIMKEIGVKGFVAQYGDRHPS